MNLIIQSLALTTLESLKMYFYFINQRGTFDIFVNLLESCIYHTTYGLSFDWSSKISRGSVVNGDSWKGSFPLFLLWVSRCQTSRTSKNLSPSTSGALLIGQRHHRINTGPGIKKVLYKLVEIEVFSVLRTYLS